MTASLYQRVVLGGSHIPLDFISIRDLALMTHAIGTANAAVATSSPTRISSGVGNRSNFTFDDA